MCLTLLSFLPSSNRFAFHPPRWNRQTIFAVTPVCTANVVGLVFNILCLKLVDASYFQVARGLTLPMTVVLSSFMTGEKPTMGTIASCGLVTWGFTYAFLPAPFLSSTVSSAEVAVLESAAGSAATSSVLMDGKEAPMLGMIFGVLSAMMVAIHAVLVKAALKSVDNKTMDLAYWQNALSALALIPGIVISGELGGLWSLVTGEEGDRGAFVAGSVLTVSGEVAKSSDLSRPIIRSNPRSPQSNISWRGLWTVMIPRSDADALFVCVSQGVVGFLICVAGLLSIKVTSPVTHMFSSAVRSVLQTMLGVWLFRDIINSSRIMSILLILCGSILYTYLKSRPRMAATNSATLASASASGGGGGSEEESKALMGGGDVEKGEIPERSSSASASSSERRDD